MTLKIDQDDHLNGLKREHKLSIHVAVDWNPPARVPESKIVLEEELVGGLGRVRQVSEAGLVEVALEDVGDEIDGFLSKVVSRNVSNILKWIEYLAHSMLIHRGCIWHMLLQQTVVAWKIWNLSNLPRCNFLLQRHASNGPQCEWALRHPV